MMSINKPILLNFVFLFLFTLFAQTANYKAFEAPLPLTDSLQIHFQKKISEAASDSLKLIDIYYNYGLNFADEGNIQGAIKQFEIALRIAHNTNNYTKIATVANYLANMYATLGDFNASNNSYKIGLEAAEQMQNSGEIAKISMNLASNYNYTGDYKKAIKYGLFALKTKETTNNLERICYHYIAMGNIFRENNNIKKWEEYVQKAYKMKNIEGCASFGDIAKIYNSLGGIAVQKEEWEKGLLYYDTLMVLSKEAEYEQGISTALTNSAGIYKQLDNFSKALELSIESEEYYSANPYDRIFGNNFKAELYNLTGQFEKGLEFALNNINTKEINYYSTEKLKCLELLYELNLNLSNYNKAFFWNDSLRNTERILRDEDIRQSIEELETKYETEKKVQQIELLTTENKLKNQRINAGIGLVVVLLIIIFLIIYILNIRKKQAELVQNNLQQQVLRAQMNPHFIFNVLGSIQNFMMKNDTRKASSFLAQFASLTRATLNNSAAETIVLSDEIEMLKNYIELERMRKENKFNYEIQYDGELEIDFINIPPMMIQPFIENAIKHGFKNLIREGFLTIKITDKTEYVEIIVEDNGNGMESKEESTKKHQSMAMTIFEKRRKLIQQKYKKDFGFELQNLSEVNPDQLGVRIRINLPVINN